ncbi:MAG: succinate dehydrogenase cytochrome b subunit [Bacteroidota bacterium]
MNNKGFHLSSLTQKTILALAGLFLILFLIVHLGINLFLLPITEGHAKIFAEVAHFMGTNPVVKVFEVVLMAAFLIHIILGIVVQVQNWKARGQRYAVYGKSYTTFGSRFMIHTGIVIFLFLILHFIHFYFIKLGITDPIAGAKVDAPAEEHFYELAVYLFSEKIIYSVVYIIAFLFLAVHLNHAFQSAFQTLGFNHPRYTPVIKTIGTIYAVVVSLGFIIIPVYFLIT